MSSSALHSDIYQQDDADAQCLFVLVEGECRILRDREHVSPAHCVVVTTGTPTASIGCDAGVVVTPRTSDELDVMPAALRLPTARTSCSSAATRIQYVRNVQLYFQILDAFRIPHFVSEDCAQA